MTATDGPARAGSCVPPRRRPRRRVHAGRDEGDRQEPAPDEVRAAGAHILLGNTYHLHFRPGAELIAESRRPPPLHGLGRPILTDSAVPGLLAARHRREGDDEGVTFRSVYDGAPARFSPELPSRRPGEAGLGHRHVPRRLPCGRVARRELERAVRLTTTWASRQREAPRRRASSCSGSPRAAPTASSAPLDRGDHGARLRRLRARRPLGRRAAAEMMRRGRVGGAAAARRQAALLHGDRRPEGSST
jgi:queuine tRNA-ribosyltransferase